MLLIDLETAHKHSSNHRTEVSESNLCGCFFCCRVFFSSKIETWVDQDRTAQCPFCNVDAVLGDGSGFEINTEFLRLMCERWFGKTLVPDDAQPVD